MKKMTIEVEGEQECSTVINLLTRRENIPQEKTYREHFDKISEKTKRDIKERKESGKVFTGAIFGWDRVGDNLIPNWEEQDIIDEMKSQYFDQNWSGNEIAKVLNEMGVKGKRGGKWTSSMVLRTCRYDFHEQRNNFDRPAQ